MHSSWQQSQLTKSAVTRTLGEGKCLCSTSAFFPFLEGKSFFFLLVAKETSELDKFQLRNLALNNVLFHAIPQEKKELKVKKIAGCDMFVHPRHLGYQNQKSFVDILSSVTEQTIHFFLFSQDFKALYCIFRHKSLHYISSLRNFML